MRIISNICFVIFLFIISIQPNASASDIKYPTNEWQVSIPEEQGMQSETLFDMLEVLYESHYRYVEACVKAGADIVQCADSLASLDVISPTMYEKYAFPYEKRFFARIDKLKSDYDFYTLLHICGDNTLILEKMAQTGCDIIEFDYKVDIAHCKKVIGDKVCLMGNLNPCGAMLDGTPEQVEREAAQAIIDGGKNGRLCLGSGCEVAAGAPLANVKAMVKVAHSMQPDFD